MAKKKPAPKPEKAHPRSVSQPRKSQHEAAVAKVSAASFPIVGVGASAGGLEALSAFLKALPARTGMAVVVIQHLAPQHESALTQILPRLTKGSLLVFDELNCRHFPGETQAVQEVVGLGELRLQRVPNQPYCAFAEYGA